MAIKRSAKSRSREESKQNTDVEVPVKKATAANKNEPVKSYKELIVEALISLNDRKGSSRPAVKKYIKEKYPSVGAAAGFDSYFNNAVKKGVELEEFKLPKGPSGTLKLIKKSDSSSEKAKTETRGRPRKTSPEPTKSNSTNSGLNHTFESNERSRGRPKANNNSSKARVEKPPKPKPRAVPSPTYKEMIISGIQQLNNGKGSSRSALKKFVRDRYKNEIKASSNFDHLFNSALKRGIESGDLHQPKGPSGIVKMLKRKKTNAVIKTV